MTAPELPDQIARDRISSDTDANLFVDAGAGSGKTKALIDRISTLVLTDGIPLRSIAAVTFTEKAGAELRDRLREQFEATWRDGVDEHKARAQAALDDLDGAAIGTLHSFAQRILTSYPIEAGLPPLVEILDEVGSSVAFDERWSVVQRQLLDDHLMSAPLLLALGAGVQLTHIRSLMKAFNADWDLVEDRVLGGSPPFALPDFTVLVDEAARLALRVDECRDPSDRFVMHLQNAGRWAQAMRDAHDDAERAAVLRDGLKLKSYHGRKGNWPDLDGLKADLGGLITSIATAAGMLADATLQPIARWLAAKVLDAADHRRPEGRLEFHDLLVLSRRLLRQSAPVRAALQQEYPRLLLDEFQDTDPIQIELAVRIAAGLDGDAEDWQDVTVPSGSLFVVGDPKQSIYRFRRADIRTFLQAEESFDERVELTTNFRTVGPILGWVNEIFGVLIQPVPDAQPAYLPLATWRSEPAVGASVTVLGVQEHSKDVKADDLRELEAADVAAAILQARDDGWTVLDRETGNWREIRLDDIAILLPARTSLPHLQKALAAAGIPYRAETSSLVYQSSEIRAVLAALRVLADPTDLLSCVTALRSELFGCGDDDLWTWRRDGGSFNILAPVPDALAEHPVGQAVSYLRRLQREARWRAPSEVLSALIQDRRLMELAATGPRTRDGWRRLRFLVDQARAWSEAEHGGLRGYLAWATHQADETSRAAESVLPETDINAVRIMTVHAAKGLEFGMVILSGMTSGPRRAGGVQLIWPPDGGYAIRLTTEVQTNDFESVQPIDEQMGEYERVRLMYVATTRARDHLVVSLHRTERQTKTNARLLSDAGAAYVPGVAAAVAAEVTPVRVEAEMPAPPPPFGEWTELVSAARERTQAQWAVSASGLEGTEPSVVFAPSVAGNEPISTDPESERPGLAKGARDVELPPWSKGRYGTAVGRAVHGVLQTVDLGTGDGLPGAVAAQCAAEGVDEFADVVTALARSALDAPEVVRAAARRPLRESFVAVEQGDGTVLEGIIDLLYRDDDGSVVVVDYKTDAIPTGAIPARVRHYRPQVDAYRRAVAAATGAPVRPVLLFLHPSGTAVAVEVG